MDNILTVNDVAKILKVQPITVREMFRTERIRAFKVGKAWRTTEKMLQEDIEMLSRGEAPEKLPKNESGAKHPAKPKKKTTTSKVPKATAKSKGSKIAENGTSAAKDAQFDGENVPDTTQQLLF